MRIEDRIRAGLLAAATALLPACAQALAHDATIAAHGADRESLVREAFAPAPRPCMDDALCAAAVPAGAWRRTCIHVFMRGPLLHAQCFARAGVLVAARLDVSACAPGSVRNELGLLACERGRGRTPPRGSRR